MKTSPSKSPLTFSSATLLMGAAVLVTGTLGSACETFSNCEETRTCEPEDGVGGAGGAKGRTDTSQDATSNSSEMGGSTSVAGATSTEQDPNSCEQDSDCGVSGECRISYEDKDGDGYGDPDVTTGRCDGSIPAGFTALAGDCCDDGGDLETAALINPGQETYFDSPANICGIAWDYDCSGEVEFGGYTCPSSDEECANEDNRDYDLTTTQRNGRFDACTDSYATCDDGCETEVIPLTKEDCGVNHSQLGCACAGSCSDGCSTCAGVTARRRVVECH